LLLVFGEDLIHPSRSREMFSVLEAYVVDDWLRLRDGEGVTISKLLLSFIKLLVESDAMWGSKAD
jgi:hypothetical protein